MSNAAVDAVAACGAMIPEKSTRNPTTPIATTAATLFVDATVPTTTKMLPTTHNPTYDTRRVRGLPVNSTNRSRAKEPNAAKRPTWASVNAKWAMAKSEDNTTAARTERLITR